MGEKQKNKGEVFVASFFVAEVERSLLPSSSASASRRRRRLSLAFGPNLRPLSLSLLSLSRALALVHAFKLRHSDYDAPRRPAIIEAQGWSAQGLESARRGRADRENSQRFFVFSPRRSTDAPQLSSLFSFSLSPACQQRGEHQRAWPAAAALQRRQT